MMSTILRRKGPFCFTTFIKDLIPCRGHIVFTVGDIVRLLIIKDLKKLIKRRVRQRTILC